MKITRQEKMQGEIMPPRCYGLAYYDWMRQSCVYYLMPFNWVVRWWRFMMYVWDTFRSRPTVIEKAINRMRDDDLDRFWRLVEEESARKAIEIVREAYAVKEHQNIENN